MATLCCTEELIYFDSSITCPVLLLGYLTYIGLLSRTHRILIEQVANLVGFPCHGEADSARASEEE